MKGDSPVEGAGGGEGGYREGDREMLEKSIERVRIAVGRKTGI